MFIVEFTTPVVFEDKLHFAVRECAELYELNDASGHLTLAQSLQVLHYVVSLQPHWHGRVQTVGCQLVLVDVLWPAKQVKIDGDM